MTANDAAINHKASSKTSMSHSSYSMVDRPLAFNSRQHFATQQLNRLVNVATMNGGTKIGERGHGLVSRVSHFRFVVRHGNSTADRSGGKEFFFWIGRKSLPHMGFGLDRIRPGHLVFGINPVRLYILTGGVSMIW